jgi:nitrite reductase/ring-hydroxylating ferredoxin subunit
MSDSDRLDRALDDLLAGRSPRSAAENLDPEEQSMLRFAQLLRGSRSAEPAPEFVETLHERLFPQPRRVSRRTAFFTAMGTLAAGIVGGLGIDRLALSSGAKATATPLVGANGRWISVAAVDDLPHGAIKAFKAGHLEGFLINRHGEIRAMSRICTHMGCQLDFEADEQAFVCPCHGAEFSMTGQPRYGPKGYALQLPPLPSIKVRQNNGSIEVWSV